MAGEGAPDSSSSSESLSQGAEIPVQCLEAALVPATRTELLGGEGGKRRRQDASPGRLPCGPLNLGGVRAAGLGKDHWEWTQLLKLKPPPTSQSGASSSYPGPVLSTVPSGDEYMLS